LDQAMSSLGRHGPNGLLGSVGFASPDYTPMATDSFQENPPNFKF